MALTRVHTDLIEGSLGGDASEELQVDTFTGDGTTVTFGLTRLPDHANNTQVYISGVYQQKDTYTVSGLNLTFSEAPAVGESIEAVVAYVNPMYSGDHVKKVDTYNHNILINPSFTVKQRGDVIDHNEDSYGPDRWFLRGVLNTKGTMSQSSTDSITGINKLVVKHRNATSYALASQSIEAVNLLGLYGKEMTVSFSYSDTGGSGIPLSRVWATDSSGTYKKLFDGVPTSLGNNRWTYTFTLTTNDGTLPDPSESGMQLTIYPNEVNTAPNEWSLWETKLEAGSLATPFIARSYGEELSLCQRYYQVFGINSMFAGRGTSTSAMGVGIVPFVPLRASPSLPPNVLTRAYSISGSTNNTNAGVALTTFDVYLYVTFNNFGKVLSDNNVGSVMLAEAMSIDSEL